MRPPLFASAISLNLYAEVVKGLSLPTMVASLRVTTWAGAGEASPNTMSMTSAARRTMTSLQRRRRGRLSGAVRAVPAGARLAAAGAHHPDPSPSRSPGRGGPAPRAVPGRARVQADLQGFRAARGRGHAAGRRAGGGRRRHPRADPHPRPRLRPFLFLPERRARALQRRPDPERLHHRDPRRGRRPRPVPRLAPPRAGPRRAAHLSGPRPGDRGRPRQDPGVHRSPDAARAPDPGSAGRRLAHGARDRQGDLRRRDARAPPHGRHVRALPPAQAQERGAGERGDGGRQSLPLDPALAAPRRADPMLLTNGRIHTMDAAGSVVDSLVIRAGRVAFAGRRGDINPAPREPTLDLGGRAVLPGLVDGHGHLMLLARARLELNLATAGSEDEIA